MPIFFLHLHVGHKLIEDPEGSDLPSLEAAKTEALEAAREIIADRIIAGNTLSKAFEEWLPLHLTSSIGRSGSQKHISERSHGWMEPRQGRRLRSRACRSASWAALSCALVYISAWEARSRPSSQRLRQMPRMPSSGWPTTREEKLSKVIGPR